MYHRIVFSFIGLLQIMVFSVTAQGSWIERSFDDYDIHYQLTDQQHVGTYTKSVAEAKTLVTQFFGRSFPQHFDVYIHPDRPSLDSTWQSDWQMPGFQSECWMVASGVADRLDIISPLTWESQACEHNASDTTATVRLITHELVHVFHGQHNASPDFSDVEGIDWFVEGLATYASGQCDSLRISEVRAAIRDNTIPNTLSDFWSGKLKYGLSGSVVMFIDTKYKRETLIALLHYNRLDEILMQLNTTENELLTSWKQYLLNLNY